MIENADRNDEARWSRIISRLVIHRGSTRIESTLVSYAKRGISLSLAVGVQKLGYSYEDSDENPLREFPSGDRSSKLRFEHPR